MRNGIGRARKTKKLILGNKWERRKRRTILSEYESISSDVPGHAFFNVTVATNIIYVGLT